jgi:iron complex outermembrane recepter protein
MMFIRSVALCVAMSGAVAGARPLQAQSVGTLSGRVTGPAGEPVPGASVSAAGAGQTAIVRSDGSYQLRLPAGRYEIRARLVGYAQVADSVTIPASGTATRDFRLTTVATSLETVTILGTRGQERTVMSAPVPIDVLSVADMQQSGRTETAQMIQAVAPSFNFARATISDGSDAVRPAMLRGLWPDQTLVLINGKRRHAASLVNVNNTIGRGAQSVDFNAIPASMIDHIEILRDGAAAQYGSDAIAGVINVVLKTNASGSFSTEFGENATTYNRDATSAFAFPGQTAPRTVRDGATVASALNYGWTLGDNGYVHVAGEVRNKDGSNRTLADTRQQYFAGDPRNSNAPAINHWQGDAYNHDTQLFFNAGQTFSNGIEVYGFGGYGHRRGASAGFWRRANDDRTVRTIFPDGFLPFIKSNIDDGSLSVGVKGDAAGWNWDLGTVYGHNAFAFRIDNSANVSLGPASTTSFDAGKLADGQSTTSLDLGRDIRGLAIPLHVGLGAEFRADQYEITAGEPDSYRDGGVHVLDANGDPTARLAPLGSQVFPGFRPTDAGSHSRTNEAAYVDLSSDLTSRWLVDVAGRVEHYSDFGSTSTGKIASRFEITKGLALRGAVSTGFRAPSLGQEFFSSTATNFVVTANGLQPFDIRTFPVSSPEAKVLGATGLKPERSVNLSGGLAIEPARGLAFTADLYRITIKDRIVLTGNFTDTSVATLFRNAGLNGVSGGRFFTNAIDTRSAGLDLVANYNVSLGSRSTLRLTSGYNNNTVTVTHIDPTPDQLKKFQSALFDRIEKTRFEHGNPRDNFFVSANEATGALSFNARTQRYGKVSVAGAAPTNTTGSLDQTFGAKWITDLSASYVLRSRWTLTAGADNIFDVYPDRNVNPGDPATSNGGGSNYGIFPYNQISPFGFNGRFVYTKLSVGL